MKILERVKKIYHKNFGTAFSYDCNESRAKNLNTPIFKKTTKEKYKHFY